MTSPRFDQPFTLSEAILFEPALITEEIARLQNSIAKLEETQVLLEEYGKSEAELYSKPDADIEEAIRSNRVVIASQKERIGILRTALERKGVTATSNPHYDLPAPEGRPRTIEGDTRVSNEGADHPGEDEGGVYL